MNHYSSDILVVISILPTSSARVDVFFCSTIRAGLTKLKGAKFWHWLLGESSIYALCSKLLHSVDVGFDSLESGSVQHENA